MTLSARRLLTMAASANHFGGMGSWNDLAFNDERVSGRYAEVSARLRDSVVQGLMAGTNAPLRPPGGSFS